ncbi:hypothetical protein [Rosistilla oblonga]|uniref:Phage-related minor tail protein n=1 Tax=Rosistilla oblonga TaxID=2527990 RepID=A0A518ITJ4_9BACT|nr:hypothetical protein [Rosistilla oblonga]QDV56402.1 hypothetical protein Mal33_23920 [Rosistilla oblonga]
MASDDAKIRMDGDTTPARAALQQVVAELRKMEGTMARMANNSQKQSKGVAKDLGGIQKAGVAAVKGLTGFIGVTSGMAAAHRAAALFRSELEAIKRTDMNAADQEVSLGRELKRFKLFSGANGLDFEGLRERAIAASGSTLSPADIVSASRETVSAGFRGGDQKKLRAEVPIKLAEWFGDSMSTDEFKALSAALGTLTDKIDGFDLGQGAALSLSALMAAPGGDPAAFSENILRGLVPILVNQFGFTFERALEVAVAAQNTTQDAEGARIRTNLPKQFAQVREAGLVFGEELSGDQLLDFPKGDSKNAQKIRFQLLRSADKRGVELANRLKEANAVGDDVTAKAIIEESAGIASVLLKMFDKENFNQLKPKVAGKSTEKFLGLDFMQSTFVVQDKKGFTATLAEVASQLNGGPTAVADLQETIRQNNSSGITAVSTLQNEADRTIAVFKGEDRVGALRQTAIQGLQGIKESGRIGTETGRGIDETIDRIGLAGASEDDVLDYFNDRIDKIIRGITTEKGYVPTIGRGGFSRGGGNIGLRTKESLTPSEQREVDQLRNLKGRVGDVRDAIKEEDNQRVVEAIDRQTEVMKAMMGNRPPKYSSAVGAMPVASQTSAE